MLDVPDDRIEATGQNGRDAVRTETSFRDKETDQEFRVEIDPSSVTFTRLDSD
jgi:hypothetical protein